MSLAGAFKAAMLGKKVHGIWTRNRVGRKLFPKWGAKQAEKEVKRRQEAEAAGGEFLYEEEQMGGLAKELVLSLVRHLAPVAAAFLAGQGIDLGEGTSPILTVALAVSVYGVMQAWSWVRKIRNKPREV